MYTEERKKIMNLLDLDDKNLDKIFQNDFLAKNSHNGYDNYRTKLAL